MIVPPLGAMEAISPVLCHVERSRDISRCSKRNRAVSDSSQPSHQATARQATSRGMTKCKKVACRSNHIGVAIRCKNKGIMQLYLNRDGQRTGPHALEDVNRRIAAGRLNPSDLGWSESSPGWKPLLSFSGVMVPGAASSTAMPIGMATPVHFESRNYAGFWIRMFAFVVDALVLAFIGGIIAFMLTYAHGRMSILRVLVPMLVCLLYMPTMWSAPTQATLGQKLCRLRVIRMDGSAVSFTRGLVRALGRLLSGAIFGFGYIMIAFSNRKRAWHDRLADTCVVTTDWIPNLRQL